MLENVEYPKKNEEKEDFNTRACNATDDMKLADQQNNLDARGDYSDEISNPAKNSSFRYSLDNLVNDFDNITLVEGRKTLSPKDGVIMHNNEPTETNSKPVNNQSTNESSSGPSQTSEEPKKPTLVDYLCDNIQVRFFFFFFVSFIKSLLFLD